MCGICGIIGTTAEKGQVLERMMKAMEHRGPDGYLRGCDVRVSKAQYHRPGDGDAANAERRQEQGAGVQRGDL